VDKKLKMKLFLTSAGFSNKKISEAFVAELGKSPEQATVLVVAYAQNENEQFYVNESVKELKDLGIKKINVFNLHNPEMILQPNFDAIYVCGGNTYSIMKKVRETKLDKFIIQEIENGAIYVGVSAGSIIAGPGIKIAGHGSEGDPNDVQLTDLNGLKLTDMIIFPHFREPLRHEVESFQKQVKQKVVALTNDQAFVILNGKSKVIE
jgi:peptidase E